MVYSSMQNIVWQSWQEWNRTEVVQKDGFLFPSSFGKECWANINERAVNVEKSKL